MINIVDKIKSLWFNKAKGSKTNKTGVKTMTLNQIQNAVGVSHGFKFKSSKTGNVFQVLSVTQGGKYLCKTVSGPLKEALLDGTVDRYVTVTDTTSSTNTEVTRLEAAIDEVNSKIDIIDSRTEALNTQREGLESELSVLEEQLEEVQAGQ